MYHFLLRARYTGKSAVHNTLIQPGFKMPPGRPEDTGQIQYQLDPDS